MPTAKKKTAARSPAKTHSPGEMEKCNLCFGRGVTYSYPKGGGARARTCSRCGGRTQVPVGKRNAVLDKHLRPTKGNGGPAQAAPAAAAVKFKAGDRVHVTFEDTDQGRKVTRRKGGTVLMLWSTMSEYGRQIGDLLVEFRPGGGAMWYHPSQAVHMRGGAGRNAPTRAPITMAAIKALNADFHRNRRDSFSYFDRKNTKLFGPETFHGPYAGNGGTFFLQGNKAGLHVKQFLPSGQVLPVATPSGVQGFEELRALARRKAAGQ